MVVIKMSAMFSIIYGDRILDVIDFPYWRGDCYC